MLKYYADMSEISRTHDQDGDQNRPTHATFVRRRIAVGAAALTAVAGAYFATTEVISAIEHANDPVPAGCDVTLRPGGDIWGIARQIAAHTNQTTGEVEFEIGRANDGIDAGHIRPGDPVGIPEEYCQVVGQYQIGQ